jgi:two-component system, NarL family, nitrate/nitrite response regulator NarL
MSSLIQVFHPSVRRPPGARPGNASVGRIENDPSKSEWPKYRLSIVGRDRMSADLLASTLNQELGCEAVSVRPDRLLETLADRKTHLAVISDELGGGTNGFDLAAATLRAYPDLMVVMLLGKPSQTAIVNAFRAGARAVTSRDNPIKEFLDCIDRVRKGYLWVGLSEAEGLLHVLRSLPAPNIAMTANATPLTERERQVVQCAATGKTNRQIAQTLRLSENTVKNYLYKAFEKMGVSRRAELLYSLTLSGHTFGTLPNGQLKAAAEEEAS